jgi:hypothetical protein
LVNVPPLLEIDENSSDAIVLIGRKFNRILAILMRIERQRKPNVMNFVMSNVEASVDTLHSSLKETIHECDVVQDVETSLAQFGQHAEIVLGTTYEECEYESASEHEYPQSVENLGETKDVGSVPRSPMLKNIVPDVETSLAQPDNQDGVTDAPTNDDSRFSTSKGEESEDQNATEKVNKSGDTIVNSPTDESEETEFATVKTVDESATGDTIALSPKKGDVGPNDGTSLGQHDKQDHVDTAVVNDD